MYAGNRFRRKTLMNEANEPVNDDMGRPEMLQYYMDAMSLTKKNAPAESGAHTQLLCLDALHDSEIYTFEALVGHLVGLGIGGCHRHIAMGLIKSHPGGMHRLLCGVVPHMH